MSKTKTKIKGFAKDGKEKIKDLFHRFDTNLNSVELEKGIDEFFGGADKIIKALLK